MIVASAFYKRSAVSPQFWEGFNSAVPDMMPQALKDGYLKANNDLAGFLNMFNRDVQRMKVFRDWTDEQVGSIQAATLVINSSRDIGSVEHAAEIYRTIPNAELAIFPGGHGAYLGAAEALEDGHWSKFNAAELIEDFLNKA